MTMRAWRGIGAAVLVAVASRGTAASGDSDALHAAVTAALQARMGAGATIEIRSLTPAQVPGEIATVSIDPSARLGAPAWVLVFTGPAASARVRVDARVVVEHARALHAIERGAVLAAGDLLALTSEVSGPVVRALPTAESLVGARALRPIAAGEIVQAGFVAALPAVRMGMTVTARARVGTVEVSAPFQAVDNGNPGEVIRIVNPDTHKTLRALVISAGIVEVINVQ